MDVYVRFRHEVFEYVLFMSEIQMRCEVKLRAYTTGQNFQRRKIGLMNGSG